MCVEGHEADADDLESEYALAGERTATPMTLSELMVDCDK